MEEGEPSESKWLLRSEFMRALAPTSGDSFGVPFRSNGAASGSLRAKRVVSILLVSAFGPYVVPQAGLRLEQFVVYPLFAVAGLTLAIGRTRKMHSVFWTLAFLLGTSAIWMLLVTAFSRHPASAFEVVAAVENLLEPVALITVMGALLWNLSAPVRRQVLEEAARWVVILLSLNALVSITSVFINTMPVLGWFVRASASGSVLSNAASMGRYSGIFNQPIEAGVAYSLGVFAWIYLVLERNHSTPWMWLGAALLVVGGLLTVSKVFILGGIPLAVIYAGWCIGASHTRLAKAVLGVGLAAGLMLSLGGWAGWGYLERLLDFGSVGAGGALAFYTAGRFGGADAPVARLFGEVWRGASLQGFGLAAYTPLDNGYLEFFYQGGLFALSLYACMLVIVGYVALRAVRRGWPEGKLMTMVWLLVIGASFGAPVLTINRASILLWILLLTAMSVTMPGSEARGSSVAASGVPAE